MGLLGSQLCRNYRHRVSSVIETVSVCPVPSVISSRLVFCFFLLRHVDGTVKFWDTSSLTLQVLYRLKTSKVFEKSRTKTLRPDGEVATGVLAGSEPGKQHLAIKQLAMCPENRLLAIAGASGHVILFKFRRQEASLETTVRT